MRDVVMLPTPLYLQSIGSSFVVLVESIRRAVKTVSNRKLVEEIVRSALMPYDAGS